MYTHYKAEAGMLTKSIGVNVIVSQSGLGFLDSTAVKKGRHQFKFLLCHFGGHVTLLDSSVLILLLQSVVRNNFFFF